MLGMSHRAAIRTSLFRVKPRPVTNSDANNHETRDARIFAIDAGCTGLVGARKDIHGHNELARRSSSCETSRLD